MPILPAAWSAAERDVIKNMAARVAGAAGMQVGGAVAGGYLGSKATDSWTGAGVGALAGALGGGALGKRLLLGEAAKRQAFEQAAASGLLKRLGEAGHLDASTMREIARRQKEYGVKLSSATSTAGLLARREQEAREKLAEDAFFYASGARLAEEMCDLEKSGAEGTSTHAQAPQAVLPAVSRRAAEQLGAGAARVMNLPTSIMRDARAYGVTPTDVFAAPFALPSAVYHETARRLRLSRQEAGLAVAQARRAMRPVTEPFTRRATEFSEAVRTGYERESR